MKLLLWFVVASVGVNLVTPDGWAGVVGILLLYVGVAGMQEEL